MNDALLRPRRPSTYLTADAKTTYFGRTVLPGPGRWPADHSSGQPAAPVQGKQSPGATESSPMRALAH
eukprot:5021112-Prymnesium_polylepis.1